MKSFTSFHAILQDVARSQGFDVRLGEHRLQAHWKEVVGDVVATHTWPTRIRFRTLFVSVDHSVWLHQLMYLKSTLLEKIQSEDPDLHLQDLVFRIGDIPDQHGNEPDSSPVVPISPEAVCAATDTTREVRNEDVRHALTQVIAKALSS